MDEITAEFETTALIPEVELIWIPKVTVAAKTDLGRVRENNEDKYEFFLPESPSQLGSRGLVFVVCDGMGGHEAGQIASELATKTFIDVYLNHPATEARVAARDAVLAANRFVYDVSRAIPGREGMGTTLSSLLLIQDTMVVAHVGDSRVYRLRGEEAGCITSDHTWVNESVKAGLITEAEAVNHPYKNVITRAIGTAASVEVDVFESDVLAGDRYLLCSDGVMNHVEDDEIYQHMRDYSPSEAVWKLVNLAITRGGSDNTTVMIVRVDALQDPETFFGSITS